MRTNELDRLNFLRNKKESGHELNEKEVARLESLEAKLAEEEIKKGEKENGRGAEGTNNRNNSGGGNSQTSGNESRESESNEQRDSDSASDANATTNRKTRGRNGQTRNSNRGNRAEGGSVGTDDNGNNRESDGGTGGTGGQQGTGSGFDNTGNNQEEKPSGLVNLKPKDIKPQRKKTKKKTSNELDADTLAALLQSGFGLIASVTRKPHWNIDEDEAFSVADPLDKVLDNLTPKQKKAIEKYSAPVTLAAAVAGIVIPRVMVDIAQSKRRKGVRINVPSERTVETSVASDVQTNTYAGEPKNSAPGNQDVTPVNDSVIAGLFNQDH